MMVVRYVLFLVLIISVVSCTNGYQVDAFWDTCVQKNIRIEISDLTASATIEFAIVPAGGIVPAVYPYTFTSAPPSSSEVQTVSDNTIDYVIHWKDSTDPTQGQGSVPVNKCHGGYVVDAFWDTCQSSEIRLEITGNVGGDADIFYAIVQAGQTPPNPITDTMTVSGVSGSNAFTVGSSNVDYEVYWEDTDIPSYSGVISIQKCANIAGDPHLLTFDGLKFDYQGYCSYILVQDCLNGNTPSFTIAGDFRSRNVRSPYQGVTRIVAINVYINGKLMIRMLEDNSFEVQGKLVNGTSASVGLDLGTVQTVRGTTIVRLHNPRLTITWRGKPHQILMALNSNTMYGNVCGLLGNADGNPENDLIKPDGSPATDVDEFGDSWKIANSCP
ncbi:IgGFc-binding protein-like [Saccoglossus kowalevskii]|uniref:Zonadhesin-like n=1 Tax=Saccoglossus kowalevskii TaxID=10224 RepID=A0A0U2T2P1_SACKO|nr:PREDICTED: zonadhesin-like [Saccoglossus kowalevskii]ALR88613.1 von Willebrand type d domain protein-like m6 [Saccoglossus kowalevskii]